MRIPANSTFTKEISKQFKQIFHRDKVMDMNLQPKKMFQVQERLDKTIIKEQDLLTRLSKLKQKKKNLQFKMHMMKYHQPVL